MLGSVTGGQWASLVGFFRKLIIWSHGISPNVNKLSVTSEKYVLYSIDQKPLLLGTGTKCFCSMEKIREYDSMKHMKAEQQRHSLVFPISTIQSGVRSNSRISLRG
jgi:hypothetical protein